MIVTKILSKSGRTKSNTTVENILNCIRRKIPDLKNIEVRSFQLKSKALETASFKINFPFEPKDELQD